MTAKSFVDSIVNKVFEVHQLGENKLSKKQVLQAIRLEALLYFNYIWSYSEKISEIHALLQGLHKTNKEELNSIHYNLDMLAINLSYISSKSQLYKAVENYKCLENNLRLFDLTNLKELKKETDFIDARIELYTRMFQEEQTSTVSNIKTITDIPYVELDGRKIYINDYKLPTQSLVEPIKRKCDSITVTISELKESALKMDMLLEENAPHLKQSYFKRMHNFKLLGKGNSLYETSEITIKEVCHIIGMVGTGKSTLIHVLIYTLSQKNYRVMLVSETVKDVLNNVEIFQALGINSSAINGEKKQDQRIQKTIEEQEMILKENIATHLTGNCYISQLSEGEYNSLGTYGTEPCYKLKYENKKILCPFYSICPRKQDVRNLLEASAVFTNTYSLMYNFTGIIKNRGRLLLLEYAIDYIDLVIFDEADSVQETLDKLTNESDYVEKILKENSSYILNYTTKSISTGDMDIYRDAIVQFITVLTGLSELKTLIKKKTILTQFERINEGQWFSLNILISNAPFLSPELKEMLQERSKDLLNVAEVYTGEKRRIAESYKKIFKKYNVKKEHYLAVQFLLALAITEKYLLSLQYELEEMQEDLFKDSSIINIFRKMNGELAKLLPKAPAGNRFGFLYDSEENSLQIFKQQAIGRSAMIDMPYLKIDKTGKPQGPNVLLLSGSSYSPGSNTHHIARPVNYLLDALDDVKLFISKSKIIHVATNIRVSGNLKKKEALLKLCESQKHLFLEAYQAQGRSLIIVNNYEQAYIVQKKLKELLGVKVSRLIRDADVETENTVQRSKLNSSKNLNYKILVAPATAISRGFNIVNEEGHSLFNKMFFFVRPMSKPREIGNVVSIVNGVVTERRMYQNDGQEATKMFENLVKCQKEAYITWNKILRYSYGIEHTSELEKTNIVVSRLILLMQLMGRLLRVTDVQATPPTIYLLDAAFKSKTNVQFDLLKEIETYLEEEFTYQKDGELMEKLYMPFLAGLKKGREHV
ncbi:hypothetical protein ACFSY7_12385 [Kurthia populi]|uniref:Uncharacterized protein n=1 Tax=Kurthia populi TaxID=1562132 RepID=A0ABW5Y2S5_9BACL